MGHPEHDLLFVATQVARAVGLKNPSGSVSSFRAVNSGTAGAFQFRSIVEVYNRVVGRPDNSGVYKQIVVQPPSQALQANSWMATEGWVYRMLMRGDSKSAADFRTWIADKVVPTIRKTGKYDAEQSTNPIAK